MAEARPEALLEALLRATPADRGLSVEFDEGGRLRRARWRRATPAGGNLAEASPLRLDAGAHRGADEAEVTAAAATCPCCGREMLRVVIVDAGLTATVLVEEAAASPYLVRQDDGVYEPRTQTLKLHAPRCPHWEGSTDWRMSAVPIPLT